MTLPLSPPIKPQLALTRKALPEGEQWAYEQKLDGFRAIVFVDGEDVYIQSRGGKPLARYFPELSFAAGRYVLDGELVICDADGNVEFDALQSRLHPAESRVALLSREIPADYVAFDLLAEGDESLLRLPFGERRARLEAVAEPRGIETSTLSADPEQAERWLRTTEGAMAKQLDAPYEAGKRRGMAKVKRERTIDCVVLGWRPGKEEGTVGSLILGLYEGGELRPVGHISGFQRRGETEHAADAGAAGDRRAGQRRAEPLGRRAGPGVGGAAAGAGDRGRLRPRGCGAHKAWDPIPSIQGRQGARGVFVQRLGRRVSRRSLLRVTLPPIGGKVTPDLWRPRDDGTQASSPRIA